MFKVDSPFPPTVSSLMAWLVVTRFVFGLAASSAGTYLAGLKTMCSIAGYSTAAFVDPQVKYLMRGLKKTCPKRFRSKPRLPITIWLLAAFVRKLSESYQDRLTAAVLSTGVHGLLRAAEYVAKNGRYFLARGNVEWGDDKVVLHVRSKTDYFKTGQEVSLWRNGSICCPWSLLKWVFDNAPDKHPGAPVFQNEDGSPFSYDSLNTAVKRLASVCGLDPASFSTHSTRFGGATTLAILGYPAHVIKDIGRWKSLAFQLYPKVSRQQYRQVGWAFGEAAGATRDWFGGLPASNACKLVWDDFSNGALFTGSPDGCVGVRWNSS